MASADTTLTSRELTDDEIEVQVIAELDDPAAWDEAIYVPPSKSVRFADKKKKEARATARRVCAV
jgi:hypothetical protein